MSVPLENELLAGGECYFTDRLAFGLKDGSLLYVEAIGFVNGDQLNPENTDLDSSGSTTQQDTSTDPSEEMAADPPPLPNAPLVYVSDQDAPNYDSCHPENSCFYQVFYNHAPLEGSAINLTQPLGFVSATEPALSPDGKYVAFTGFMEGGQTNHIYVIRTDGSELRRITPDTHNSGHPTWSPDGKLIAIMARTLNGSAYNLYIVDISTLDFRQLTTGNFMDRFPDWSPDGNSIAFHTNRIDPEPETCWPNCLVGLFIVDAATGQGQPIMSAGSAIIGAGPDWHPDGDLLAFHSQINGSWDIYTTDLDGSILQLSTASGSELWPSWSPDGYYIAFSGDTSTGTDIGVTSASIYDPVYYTGKAAFDIQPDW
jgi:Tol biopolymer transport system component